MSTKRSKDRTLLCSFLFADGRQCTTPRCSAHPHLCYFHARKEAQANLALQAGRDISSCFSFDYVSACDLSQALSQLFCAVAHGSIKPKTATTLAYLGQTILQTIHVAGSEYAQAFGSDAWRRAIRSSFAPPELPPPPPEPKIERKPGRPPAPQTPSE